MWEFNKNLLVFLTTGYLIWGYRVHYDRLSNNLVTGHKINYSCLIIKKKAFRLPLFNNSNRQLDSVSPRKPEPPLVPFK